jgi:hypothetical protein
MNEDFNVFRIEIHGHEEVTAHFSQVGMFETLHA